MVKLDNVYKALSKEPTLAHGKWSKMVVILFFFKVLKFFYISKSYLISKIVGFFFRARVVSLVYFN